MAISTDQEMSEARLHLWGWSAVKFVMGTVSAGVVAESIRIFVPMLGQKFYRTAALAFLGRYELTHGLDMAIIFAGIFTVIVWSLIEKSLKLWLPSDCIDRTDLLWNSQKEMQIVAVLATFLISIDGLLFYMGIVRMKWGSSLFSVSAMVATVAYMCILVFINYATAKLQARIVALQASTDSETVSTSSHE